MKNEPQYLKDVIRGYVVEAEEQVDILIKKLGGQGFKFMTKAEKDVSGHSHQYKPYKDILEQWAISMMMDIQVEQKKRTFKRFTGATRTNRNCNTNRRVR